MPVSQDELNALKLRAVLAEASCRTQEIRIQVLEQEIKTLKALMTDETIPWYLMYDGSTGQPTYIGRTLSRKEAGDYLNTCRMNPYSIGYVVVVSGKKLGVAKFATDLCIAFQREGTSEQEASKLG